MDVCSVYECLQCSEKLGLSDRPVMTIRKGKAMYYCQACWKLSKDNKSANNSPLMQQKKFSSGPAAAKVNSGMPATPSAAPKTTLTTSTKTTTVTKTTPAPPQVAASATGRQNVPNGGGPTKKFEPKKDVVLCPKSGAAGTQDEELKPLKPSVPGGVTTNLLKNAKDEEDLAAITGKFKISILIFLFKIKAFQKALLYIFCPFLILRTSLTITFGSVRRLSLP